VINVYVTQDRSKCKRSRSFLLISSTIDSDHPAPGHHVAGRFVLPIVLRADHSGIPAWSARSRILCWRPRLALALALQGGCGRAAGRLRAGGRGCRQRAAAALLCGLLAALCGHAGLEV